jgi:hypothetical protein
MGLNFKYKVLIGGLVALYAGRTVADEFPQPKTLDRKVLSRPPQPVNDLTKCALNLAPKSQSEQSIMVRHNDAQVDLIEQEDYCGGGARSSGSDGGLLAGTSDRRGAISGTGGLPQPRISSQSAFTAGRSSQVGRSAQEVPSQTPTSTAESILAFLPQMPLIQPATPSRSAACFLGDTRILTPTGERRIQDLRIGDLVTTPLGDKPIKWIPRQIVRRAVHERWSAGAAPVVIQRDAISESVPNRTLSISPLHMLYIEDAFVEAKDLVNGTTIVRTQPEETSLEYYNIELQGHTIVFANGLPVETYNPNSSLDRESFENFSQYCSLYSGEEYKSYSPLMRRKGGIPNPSSRDLMAALRSKPIIDPAWVILKFAASRPRSAG